MPRGPRLDAPGALHHAMARGIERCTIFRSDVDRYDFLERLAGLCTTGCLTVYAWSLLSNHLHLLVRTGSRSIAHSMQRLCGGYAAAFNRRHQRAGYLFQSRFRSVIVEDDPYLLELLRYIHLNPLRAGMLPDLAALDQYAWTGHAALLGHCERPWQDTNFVLSQFGSHVGTARQAYRAHVADGLARPEPDLAGGGLRRRVDGWHAVGTLRRGRERWASDERILGSTAFVATLRAEAEATPQPLGVPVDPARFVSQVLSHVANRFDLHVAEVTTNTRRRRVVQARALVSYAAVRNAGLSARRVAPLLGVDPRTVLKGVWIAEHRFPLSVLADPLLQPTRRPTR